jgi:VanZ family protein
MKMPVRLLKYWLPVVVWALVIFNFSAHGVPKVGPSYWTDFIAKKAAHILEYGFLALLTYRALLNSGVKIPLAYYIAIIIPFIYGASDELHQSFTPTRTPTVRDVLIDTAGATLAMWFVAKLLPKATGTVKLWARKLELLR